MAVFLETIVFVDRIETLRRRLQSQVDTVSDAVATIFDILDGVRGTLRIAEDALKALANAVDSAANAIGRIPAPGPWRIVPILARAVLEGVASAVRGFAEAIEALRKRLLSRRRLRRFEDLLEQLDAVTIRYAAASANARTVLDLLRRLAEILETQQEPIERAFPSLPPTVRGLLASWNERIDPIEQAIAELERNVQAIERALNELERVVDLLRSIHDLRAIVEGQLGTLVQRATELTNAVVAFVSAIPFIGYFLNKLEELIQTAARALGVQGALEALGAEIKKLPFFQRIQEFLDTLERALNELEAALRQIEQVIARAELFAREIDARAKQLIEELTGVTIDKDLIEELLPNLVETAYVRVKSIRERLTEDPEGVEGLADARQSVVRIIHTATLGPRSGFGKTAYAELAPSLDVLAEQLGNSAVDADGLTASLPTIEAARSVLARFVEAMPPLPEDYFARLRRVLQDTTAGAEYLKERNR